MASAVIMPRMGQSMEEGRIVRWLHAPGDPVTAAVGGKLGRGGESDGR